MYLITRTKNITLNKTGNFLFKKLIRKEWGIPHKKSIITFRQKKYKQTNPFCYVENEQTQPPQDVMKISTCYLMSVYMPSGL